MVFKVSQIIQRTNITSVYNPDANEPFRTECQKQHESNIAMSLFSLSIQNSKMPLANIRFLFDCSFFD